MCNVGLFCGNFWALCGADLIRSAVWLCGFSAGTISAGKVSDGDGFRDGADKDKVQILRVVLPPCECRCVCVCVCVR